VAHVAGRMEFGARALGNRSILANASDPKVIRIINELIKGRDFWMPFAPTILAERMNDYLTNPRALKSPFMMMTFDSTPLAQKELIGALHPYDYTMRPQLLTEEANPKYYKIIKEFEKLTGIGGVLNTSFNLHGFPIAKGPKEAIDVLKQSGLEFLCLENYLITKKESLLDRIK
jgi:carbamoyltransferase